MIVSGGLGASFAPIAAGSAAGSATTSIPMPTRLIGSQLKLPPLAEAGAESPSANAPAAATRGLHRRISLIRV
jgi:hypothetical protein